MRGGGARPQGLPADDADRRATERHLREPSRLVSAGASRELAPGGPPRAPSLNLTSDLGATASAPDDEQSVLGSRPPIRWGPDPGTLICGMPGVASEVARRTQYEISTDAATPDPRTLGMSSEPVSGERAVLELDSHHDAFDSPRREGPTPRGAIDAGARATRVAARAVGGESPSEAHALVWDGAQASGAWGLPGPSYPDDDTLRVASRAREPRSAAAGCTAGAGVDAAPGPQAPLACATPCVADPRRTGGATAIADILNVVARQVRSGELVVVAPSILRSNAEALAYVVAALIADRPTG